MAGANDSSPPMNASTNPPVACRLALLDSRERRSVCVNVFWPTPMSPGPAAQKHSFSLSVSPRAGGVVVKLAGVIDETFAAHLLIEAARGLVVLDLDGVTRITSFGVREWVNAMRACAADYLGLW